MVDLTSYLVAGKDPTAASMLDPAFQTSLYNMFQAAPGRMTINSGYRSPAYQKGLYDKALVKYGSEKAARHWVAPPGKSKHNYGLAADLGYADPSLEKWAHANAAKYGLNFRMGHEGWHIEPLGAKIPGQAPQAVAQGQQPSRPDVSLEARTEAPAATPGLVTPEMAHTYQGVPDQYKDAWAAKQTGTPMTGQQRKEGIAGAMSAGLAQMAKAFAPKQQRRPFDVMETEMTPGQMVPSVMPQDPNLRRQLLARQMAALNAGQL